MDPTLSYIEGLAHEAGEILRQGYRPRPGYGPPIRVDSKGEIDLVTEFDRRSESYLLREIRGRFPDHRIVTEESGIVSGNGACQWFIDPLDGTINYAHGVPIFSVSIAYQEDGVLRLGAVYDPMQDECFSAERGRGAWLNGEPIQASTTANLIDSLLVTGFPYDLRSNPDNNLARYTRMTLLTQGVRRLGSAALDMCYVAAGRMDGYWEIRLAPWDLAAGALIAEEAGAAVTDLEGGVSYMSPPYSIIAANRYLHGMILEELKEGDK
jgi:myo-inositol-1(or 4)-monophosphatase